MGRELKKVFDNERTETIMQSLYISKEGAAMADDDTLTVEEAKVAIRHLWNSCELLMAAGQFRDRFDFYCARQEFEEKEETEEEK